MILTNARRSAGNRDLFAGALLDNPISQRFPSISRPGEIQSCSLTSDGPVDGHSRPGAAGQRFATTASLSDVEQSLSLRRHRLSAIAVSSPVRSLRFSPQCVRTVPYPRTTVFHARFIAIMSAWVGLGPSLPKSSGNRSRILGATPGIAAASALRMASAS